MTHVPVGVGRSTNTVAEGMFDNIDPSIKKMRIGVLMGGWSSEREISLRSGNGVLNALKEMGLKAKGIDITEESIRKLPEEDIDVAYIMIHGTPGEDGKIQSFLELLNIRYTGSDAKGSMISMDKLLSKFLFKNAGLNTPEGIYVEDIKEIEKKTDLLRFPVMAKPRAEGSSVGSRVCDTLDELMEHLNENLKKFGGYLIERFIEGMIVTVGILGDEVLPLLELVPKKRFYDYEAKYTKGMTEFIIPARLEKNVYSTIEDMALTAHRVTGCRAFSRVDFVVERNKTPYVLEVNSIPGMTELSDLPAQAKHRGISYHELVYRILEYSLK